jgi:mono/diheme cytochrome c family protein
MPGRPALDSNNDSSPMKTTKPLGFFKPRLLAAGLAIFAGATWVVNGPIVSAGPRATPETPVVQTSRSGATLYAVHCSRCHAERYPKEFNSGQWATLMIHMRVRANLSAQDARDVLKYLQEECGQ